ncbi:translation initiation factor IF-2 [Aureococcus anophagefferens]|nr:translation initiation factor IF-2 [Aureococcus anophagefferens]
MAPQDDVAASGVEIPFKSHNIDPKDIQGGTKAAERKAKAKEAWHSELIRFEVWHESGEVEKFRLPRRKCQERSIQNFVFRSKKPFLIDYMQETETNEVIYLHEALSKCQGKPRNYKLVPRAIREIDDAADKDTYEGSLALVLDQEEDDEVQNAVGRVEVIAEEIEEVKVNMADVPFMMLFDAAGKELDGDAADAEREIKYQEFLAIKESLETKLENAKLEAQEIIRDRDRTPIVLTSTAQDKDWTGHNNGTNSWYVSFMTEEAWQLEQWVANKQDWDGIKLALSHEADADTGKFRELLPPWSGRGDVPDGSKPYLPDYSPYVVNMASVRVRRVEHGFGVHKTIQSEQVPFDGPNFEYYHGQFHGGKKHGHGVEYTDSGVYTGKYKHGMRWGSGRMDYAGGDAYDGDFGCHELLSPSVLPEGNPYEFGVPHGKGRRTFADGSIYVGEFAEGRVTGRGRYESSVGETLEGTFIDGILHGKEGYLQTVIGEEYRGGFDHGASGQKSGRGFEVFADGTEYEGYFFLNHRCGHGVMKYGKKNFEKRRKRKSDRPLTPRTIEALARKEAEAKEAERLASERISSLIPDFDFNYKYEGNWLMGAEFGRAPLRAERQPLLHARQDVGPLPLPLDAPGEADEKAIQSDFEEMEERRRTINYKNRLEAARQHIVRAEEKERGLDDI